MNTKKTFSYKEAFKFALSAFIDNFLTFFIMSLITAGLSLAILALCAGMGFGWAKFSVADMNIKMIDWHTPLFFGVGIGAIFVYILWIYYMYQILRAGFALYENKPIHWRDFFITHNTHFSTFFFAMLWFHIKVIIGFILLIIPGFYLLVKYWFTGFSLIEKKTTSVGEDATHAKEVSKNAHWPIFWFYLIISIIYSIARSGVYFFVPIGLLAAIHAYKQLTTTYENVPPQE